MKPKASAFAPALSEHSLTVPLKLLLLLLSESCPAILLCETLKPHILSHCFNHSASRQAYREQDSEHRKGLAITLAACFGA